MSTSNKTIIEATTELAFSGAFQPVGTLTITAGVLNSEEGVQLQYTHDGSTWQPLYLNGILQEITTAHSLITVVGPGKYRCLKSATTNPVSVTLWGTEEAQ